jgi:hypothetical protein
VRLRRQPLPRRQPRPTAAPADGIDAQIAEQQQRQLELLEEIDRQGRGAQGLGLPANTGALEAELQIVNEEINRLRGEKAAAATAATAKEENRLVSEDAARQARYNRNVIGSILNDPALNRIVGRIEGQTQPGTIAGAALFGEDQLNLLAKIDQLEGQVFLEARDMLRGGGQITDFEGRRAQTALSRIGQRGVSEEAYRQALTELDQVFANSEARALGQPVPFPEIDTDPDAENTSAASAPRASGGDIPQITSDAEYDVLPSGAQFMAPDGTIRRKP